MSHQPINSFGLLMHAASLFCVTALLFFFIWYWSNLICI